MRSSALLLLLLAALLLSSVAVAERQLNRQKRRVDQLGHMITATTGLHYANFIGYGNYCGPGGAGVPVDEIDACCKVHDECYDRLGEKTRAKQCGEQPGPVFNRYLSRFEYKQDAEGNLVCLDRPTDDYSTCLRELCTCDKVFAKCLIPHKEKYDKKHLKENQKYLRYLVLLAETAPQVSEWLLRLIESLLG